MLWSSKKSNTNVTKQPVSLYIDEETSKNLLQTKIKYLNLKVRYVHLDNY